MIPLRNIWNFLSRKEIIAIFVISFLSGFLLRGFGTHTVYTDSHRHDGIVAGSENKVEILYPAI